MDDRSKAAYITQVFNDAYNSPLSLIILDSLERLLDYVPIGPRFSNLVLQTLLVLIKKIPKHEERKLMIIATSSSSSVLEDMQLRQVFNVNLKVPQVSNPDQVKKVLEEMGVQANSSQDLETIAGSCAFPIPIKPVFSLIDCLWCLISQLWCASVVANDY